MRGRCTELLVTDHVFADLDRVRAGGRRVSLHVPMSREAAWLDRAEAPALMDGQPILINTARGGRAPECPVNSIPATVS